MLIEQSVLVIPDKAKLSVQFLNAKPHYEETLSRFLEMVKSALLNKGLKPTLKGRVKDFESYYAKKLRLLKMAWTDKTSPLPVNDILAIRIVCPFLGDLAIAEKILAEHFSIEEIERKGAERSFKEFGYESIHVLVRLPNEITPLCPHLERNVIEIQLRTILQEAWAEVEHELVYKAEFTPFDEPMRRKLAALNANLTLSDIIFQEILEFEKRLNAELGHRREAFYRKIEEVADEPEAQKNKADRNIDGLSKNGNPVAVSALTSSADAAFPSAMPPSSGTEENTGASQAIEGYPQLRHGWDALGCPRGTQQGGFQPGSAHLQRNHRREARQGNRLSRLQAPRNGVFRAIKVP